MSRRSSAGQGATAAKLTGREAPEQTRSRLLQAGLRLFAARGFEGVTTRALAAEAGVNQAAIPYHFGGKEGLYLAVAREVIAFVGARLMPLAAQVRAQVEGGAGRPELAALLGRLVRALVTNVVANPQARMRQAFVMREYASPGAAFEIIYRGGVEELHRTIAHIVAAAMRLDPESEEAVVRAHTVMGQVFGFVIGRAVLCRRLGWEGYENARGELVAELAADMALRATGLAGEEG